MNIQELFNQFLFECEFVRRAAPQTLRGYELTFNLLIKLFPALSCGELTATTITQFFRLLQERKRMVGRGTIKIGIRLSTVTSYSNKLNSCCEWLLLHRHIDHNPFATIQVPTPIYDDAQYISRTDVERILTAIYLHGSYNIFLLKRNIALFSILLYCGLRREELLLLQIRDISLEQKVLTIRAETSKSKRTRHIPLHSFVILHLKEYLVARRHYKTPLLFASSTQDRGLSLDGLKHLVEKLRTASRIPFRLHQFRHTFAVNFLKATNNIVKLQQLLGHQDIRMTAAYVRCLPVHEFRKDIESMNLDSFI